jgi:hypothetical protein
MKLPMLFAAVLLLAACDSPEAHRVLGGGPGADTGNRPAHVRMHEGSKPFYETPRLIPMEGPPVAMSEQAREMSR